MKIGYQGIEGSNSEASARSMAKRLGWTDVEYIPLVHSRGVVEALLSGAVDCGVMATLNHVAGVVQETESALRGVNYRMLALDCIPIHHCLFVKDASVTEIRSIASHIQALEQCRGTLIRDYPDAAWKEEEDTAIAARYLAEGLLPRDAGVLCRRDAGEAFGLHLVRENLEDDAENATEFELIRLSRKGPDKLVVVAGLGLLGGSMAKALKRYTSYTVYGWNRTRSVAEKALAEGAVDGVADEETLARCDLLIPALYPEAAIQFLRRTIPLMKRDAQVVDLVGVKQRLVEEIAPIALAHGVRFTGGHPMAGLARAGYDRSYPDLFQGASMILVPTEATVRGDLEALEGLFAQVGFRRVKVCDARTHDRMIAHTSQLAHIVSNSYVKSPVSPDYVGFSGGSYKDMTRIACLDERVWKELFLLNREALLPEIDLLVRHMSELRDAIGSGDGDRLEELLRQGREAKEHIDTLNPDQPSE
ncbi:prephenate dehydrogenase/arogenate dehydrogenase family protein [uncultured Oscillibacter sp.]|uniref:prephenate dehydrogenase/arogenate dehydrogenase family protein n=1 Tax=uncultured Oscillibacter sp. TaxID=876091 RepID=UPI0026210B17|nr:prephenate dehydrogenase/arogenate dehydrogenase family protein [uncultured Oscillibacter sp.]